MLATGAGAGSKTGSGAAARSSTQPPGPGKALGDTKPTRIYRRGQILFLVIPEQHRQLKVEQAEYGPSAGTGV